MTGIPANTEAPALELKDEKADSAILPLTEMPSATDDVPSGPPHPLYKHSETLSGPELSGFEELIEDATAQLVADKEKLWRPHAKVSSRERLADLAIPSAEEIIRNALTVDLKGDWPTLDECILEDTLLSAVDELFFAKTDIPRELPFFAVLHYVSALLLQRGVEIQFDDDRILPDIWTIALASSGAGKTWTQNRLEKSLGAGLKLFPDADSSLAFVENLRDHNNGLWLKDEFAQFIWAMENDKNLTKAKGYLLQTYDHSDITWKTKATHAFAPKPAISIFGTTPFANLKDYLNRDLLLGGFVQRFSFVVASEDERLVGLYRVRGKSTPINDHWEKLVANPVHPVYYVDEAGIAAYEEAFKHIVQKARSIGIDKSFSRRISFRAFKYALVYHFITGKKDNLLHASDLAMGARICALHLRDLRKVLDDYEHKSGGASSAPVKTGAFTNPTSATSKPAPPTDLERVTDYLTKLRDSNGAPVTPSKIQGGIRPLRDDAPKTRALIEQAIANDATLAPFVKLPIPIAKNPPPATP